MEFGFLSKVPLYLCSFPARVKVKKRKKQKGNLVQAGTFSSASITAKAHKPCFVATMSAMNQRRITIQGSSNSFSGCKESRNTKSKEDEQNGTDRNRL